MRLAMLTALAALPPGRWQEQDLSDLTRIVRDALDASDLSSASVQALLTLVTKLLPFYPAWSAPQLALIYREREYIRLPQLGRPLTTDETRQLAHALLPMLHAWQDREHEGILVALSSLFKKRIRDFPELQTILEKLLQDTRNNSTVWSILHFFSLHLPERLDVLVPRLLELDKSFITIGAVSSYLHRHRQDLLTKA
ncbi:hypothetical protein KDW_64260 [Dictyobacter vulcani]|uniref:Uncharacterized protein n=1 Tax=Dictyobacter vulcani TaxID=2607529 RepID=A0A5J4KSE4_9CHLR|nr:hypothetical protein [Dictyobacter vulcani]GER92264.1 hypothetical protein KDW_64260 [Dictyobacter vulcani]